MPVLPSSTIFSPPSIVARQESSSTLVTVPANYGGINNSPHPGIVAAIVLGSVLGFLLLLYLLYAALHGGPVIWTTSGDNATTVGGMSTVTGDTSTYGTRSAVSFQSRRDRSRRPRKGTATSTRSRSRTTVRTSDRKQRRMSPLIVEPARGGPIIIDSDPPRVVPLSGPSALSEEDEIVVMEEHSPSPPRRSHSQRYRRDGPYRDDYGPRDYSPRRESRRHSRGPRD